MRRSVFSNSCKPREVKRKMAANLSKVAGMGSCINGHVVQNDNTMSEPLAGQEKVAILDAGAQYGKVRSLPGFVKIKCKSKDCRYKSFPICRQSKHYFRISARLIVKIIKFLLLFNILSNNIFFCCKSQKCK